MAPERTVDPNDPAAAAPARVLVVDDHEVAREALCSILGREPDLEVVGEAAGGEMALSLARRLWPYLVLLDGRVPGTDGLTAARRMKARSRHPRAPADDLRDARRPVGGVRAGAGGYRLKGASKQELLATIRSVLRGQQLVRPTLTDRLLRQVALGGHQASTADLTARQRRS